METNRSVPGSFGALHSRLPWTAFKRRPHFLQAQKIWEKMCLRLVGGFERMVEKTSLESGSLKNGFSTKKDFGSKGQGPQEGFYGKSFKIL
jgi:hypothetical protein